MAHAYTPGLKVTERAVIRKTRRLPLLGEVLVEQGKAVSPDTIVARTDIPGNPQTVNVANSLGVEPEDIAEFMKVKTGGSIKKGEIMAEYRSFFGLFKHTVTAPVDGVVEMVSTVTGQVTLREPPIPIQVDAYIDGIVEEVLPKEGVVIRTEGAFIQGIFGVGGETQGVIRVAVDSPDDVLEETHIKPEDKGKVIVGGSLVTASAIQKAGEVGALGIVAGGIIDTDLIAYLGHDIGVAITGHEDVPVTVIITEGFGKMRMAHRTFGLLKNLQGFKASINGATQIRAGVMRPEIIVAGYQPKEAAQEHDLSQGLVPGTPLRIIREPYFGQLAEVVDLPPELQVIETEAHVRILRAKLADGTIVTVPRANVEIIEA
ncbi:MAG: hypothetical protein ACOX5Q_07555 [Bacillota bacterium]|jgi:hypothetical protein|nr:hypothetical protein [Candidatus Fermentithermobacillaceae bacterium]